MKYYFTVVAVLLCMILINCALHALANRQEIVSYFKNTSQKDWILNIKTVILWAFTTIAVYELAKLNLSNLMLKKSFSAYEYIFYFFLVFFIHGFYIYFSHRAMHTFRFLKKYHGLHHVPRIQTPLSSWSIHPVESVIDSLGIFLVGMLIPAPLEIFVIYTFFSFQINIWAHFSLPKDANIWLRRYINFAGNYNHHNIHHYRPKKNYGAFILVDWALGSYTRNYPKGMRNN